MHLTGKNLVFQISLSSKVCHLSWWIAAKGIRCWKFGWEEQKDNTQNSDSDCQVRSILSGLCIMKFKRVHFFQTSYFWQTYKIGELAKSCVEKQRVNCSFLSAQKGIHASSDTWKFRLAKLIWSAFFEICVVLQDLTAYEGSQPKDSNFKRGSLRCHDGVCWREGDTQI